HENRISGTFFMMIFHYSIINTCKGMKKRALCPLSGVHLTIKPKSLRFYRLLLAYKTDGCH
ncbi:hypothetical protein, partial [Prevotella pallens]